MLRLSCASVCFQDIFLTWVVVANRRIVGGSHGNPLPVVALQLQQLHEAITQIGPTVGLLRLRQEQTGGLLKH